MGRKRIIIVDDDVDLLVELDEILTLSGYDTIALKDSTAVLDTACMLNPDLIVVDLKMEGMDGFQVNDELKKYVETASIPVIAMTGYFNEEEYTPLMQKSGMKACLSKPFNPLDLISQIEMFTQ